MSQLSDDAQAIYHRLLKNEPDAHSDFIRLLLDPLVKFLYKKHPSLPDPTLIADIVIDSLFKFVQEPGLYDARKSSVWSYLCLDVQGDLLNALDKEKRRQRWEVSLDAVADNQLGRNNDIADLIIDKLAPTLLPVHTDMEKLSAQLRSAITDPIDWQLIDLICDGERKTAVYAELLEILHLSQNEQTKIVKKHKDRLRVQLKRLGVKINEK